MTFRKLNLASSALAFYMLALSAFLFERLPDTLPLRYGLDGQAAGYQSKLLAAFLLPMTFIILTAVIRVLVNQSPAKFSMPNSKNALDMILFGTGLLLAAIHSGLLVGAQDPAVFLKFFSVGMGLFLLIVGNVWGKTERNFFLGLRLPWTLASEANWRATHRFAGKLMVLSGLMLLLLSALAVSMVLTIVIIGVAVVTPAIYSFIYFKKYESEE